MTSTELRLHCAGLFFASFLWLAVGHADTNAAAARALFNEARALAAQGDHAAACPKFEESLRLRPGDGTRFNLADCWEQIGRTASAWGEFLEVASSSKRTGRKDRETLARRRAAALEPKLSRLTIRAPEGMSELTIERNGVEVRAGTWGTAVPIDPGTYTIEARSPGKKTWSADVVVHGTEPVSVEVPKLERDQPELKARRRKRKPSTFSDDRAPAAETEVQQDQGSSDGSGRALVYVAGGAGAALVVLGTVFYFDFKSKNSDAAAMCRTACSRTEVSEHNELVDRAQTSRKLSYVGFGLGALALGAGAVLYFTTDDSSPETARSLELSPVIGGDFTGLGARGRF